MVIAANAAAGASFSSHKVYTPLERGTDDGIIRQFLVDGESDGGGHVTLSLHHGVDGQLKRGFEGAGGCMLQQALRYTRRDVEGQGDG